jgi:hypothetical protein
MRAGLAGFKGNFFVIERRQGMVNNSLNGHSKIAAPRLVWF